MKTGLNLPAEYTRVDNYLIRGQHPSVKTLYQLKKYGVNKVYDFRHYSNVGMKFIEKIACKLMKIDYNRVAYSTLQGEFPTVDTFEKVSNDVNRNGKEGGITLFHCNSGKHRTALFAAFYALTHGESLVKVQQQKENTYNSYRDTVIKEQILDKNYFNRLLQEYHGKNPFKIKRCKHNNDIFAGIKKGYELFISMTNKK